MSETDLDPDSQLEGYAFTVNNAAYELDEVFSSRAKPWKVTALQPSNKSVGDIKKDKKTNDFEPMFEWPEDETDTPKSGEAEYLVVGVLPFKDYAKNQLSSFHIKGQPVGCSLPKEILSPNQDKSLPWRVATPISKDHKRGTRLYALCEKDIDTGLCQVFAVNQAECFYFPEYRDNQTSDRARKSAWNDLVSSVAKSTNLPFADRRHGKPIRMGIHEELASKLAILSAGLTDGKLTKDVCYDMCQTIKKAVADENLLPETLRAFFNCKSDKQFMDSDIKSIQKFLQKHWVDVGDITMETLKSVREGLCEAQLTIPLFNVARKFLQFVAVAQEARPDISPKAAVEIAYRRAMIGYEQNSGLRLETPQPTDNGILAMLNADIEYVKDHYDKLCEQTQSLAELYGTLPTPASVDDIYAQLPQAVDKHDRRRLFDQSLGIVCRKFAYSYSAASESIGVYLKYKTNLRDSIAKLQQEQSSTT